MMRRTEESTEGAGEQTASNDEAAGIAGDVRHAACGLAMGAADIVPGVSGGTVALILGIYERLVQAISSVDVAFARDLLALRIADAARRIDLRFLVALFVGIGTGVVGLASLMNHLLTDASTRPATLAAFFGLILASSVLVARMARDERSGSPAPLLGAGVLGAVFAFWLTGLRASGGGDPTLPYVFMSGAIAICAMILPGISGAFLLVLLGMYVPVTGILKRLPSFDLSGNDLVMLVTFASGCAIGLLSFSRFLRWLLRHHGAITLAVLGGFMIGSLRKIWPFQRDVTLENLDRVGLPPAEIAELQAHPESIVTVEMKHRLFENTWPSGMGADTLIPVSVGIACVVFVFAVDAVVRRTKKS